MLKLLSTLVFLLTELVAIAHQGLTLLRNRLQERQAAAHQSAQQRQPCPASLLHYFRSLVSH